MSTAALARKYRETFDAVEEMPTLAENMVASDEEVNAASSYVLAEHIDAYKELAKYDTN